MSASRRITGIPGALRYELVRYKAIGTTIARVLDILYVQGYEPCDVITEQELIAATKDFQFSKNIREKVLHATVPWTGQPVFERVRPEQFMVIGKGKRIFHPKLSESLKTYSQKGGKNRGRPKLYYLVPDITTWRLHYLPMECELTVDDLLSNKTYRQALQREYTRNRSGIQQTRKKRGGIVGMSSGTSSKYDKGIGTIVIPAIHRYELTPRNILKVLRWKQRFGDRLEAVGTGSEIEEHHVEIEKAIELLTKNCEVYFCRRGPNHYFAPDDPEGLRLQAVGLPIGITLRQDAYGDWYEDDIDDHYGKQALAPTGTP